MKRFIFPSCPLHPKKPDSLYEEQERAFRNRGFATSVVPVDDLTSGKARINPPAMAAEEAVYRGWMLDPESYSALTDLVERDGARMFTSPEAYLAAHYLPNWYPLLSDLTPETRILPLDADFQAELTALGWEQFFVKDYVKSLKTSTGSVIDAPASIHALLAEMLTLRGTIEGGICIRRVEPFLPATETRYFVVNGRPYGAREIGPIPDLVTTAAARIRSPFFSVDVIERSDGQLRIVEVGDGQVSDIVGWTPERLVEVWSKDHTR